MDAQNGVRRPARQLRLALAQINVTVGDLAGNVARILTAAREARTAGAQVVCVRLSWRFPAIRRKICCSSQASSTTICARSTTLAAPAAEAGRA